MMGQRHRSSRVGSLEPFLHTAGITATAGLDTSEVKLGREEKQRTGGKHPSPPQEEHNERQTQRPLSLWG